MKKIFKMKISIITATFNSELFIIDAISSVEKQSYSLIEHLIIDGASKDETIQLIKQSPNRVFNFISEPDKGIYDALNKGIKLATGDVIGVLHSDDEFYDLDVIKKVMNIFQTSTADIVYGDLVYVNKKKIKNKIRYWTNKPFKFLMLNFGWMPPHPSTFVKKEVFEKHGVYDTSLKIAADYDFLLRIFKDPDLQKVYLPSILIRMRSGGASNKNLKNIFLKMKEDYLVLKRNKLWGLFTLFFKNIRKLSQFIK
jgi:glycosyltransferase involved in cell wall biosynthesis